MASTTQEIAVGDSVRTKVQMYFVDAYHPETGDEIETRFPRGHRLTICGLGDGTVDVSLPGGYVATIAREDVEL